LIPRALLLASLFLLLGCPPGSDGGGDGPRSDDVDTRTAEVLGTWVDEDGDETSFEAIEEASLWFCGADCFSLRFSFDLDGTTLVSGLTFETPDPPEEGTSAVYYGNVNFLDEDLFARQGEHPNVEGSWGAAPGGDMVIESACEDCADDWGAASGYLDGPSELTVYDATTDEPNGATLRFDDVVFRDAVLVY